MAGKEIHLVTGANGRTGLALCAELKSRGFYVRAMIRPGRDKYVPSLQPYTDEIVTGDICNPASLRPVFRDVTFVYHLAGIVSIASAVDPEIEAVNIGGVKNIIDACLENRVRRLVHTGTVHTLPFSDNNAVLREIPRFQPNAVHGAYAVTKAAGSNLVLDAVRDRSLNAVIGMPSGIIGAFELKRSNFGQMIVDVAEKKMPVYVTGRYDFVDVRDVVKALADLATAGKAGESYIISGHIATVKELVTWAADAAGVRPPLICIPLPVVTFFARFAEQAALRAGKTLTFTPYAMKVLGDNCNFSHGKLTALTGYSPRPLKEAVKEQVEYYFRVFRPYLGSRRTFKAGAW